MKKNFNFGFSNVFLFFFLFLSISANPLISSITNYISQLDPINFRNLDTSKNTEEDPHVNPDLFCKANNICKRGSNDLLNYFTNIEDNSTDIDISEMAFSQETEETPEYIQILVEYITKQKTIFEILLPYGMHILPIVVCFGVTILSIVGWLLCCICCCCCNCCCCCCCKKSSCKCSCFIFNFIFYVVIVICAFFGFTNSGKFFNSIGDTACSFVQFYNQLENGQKLDGKLPKWKGVKEIKNILNNINTKTKSIDKSEIQSKYNDVIDLENGFTQLLVDSNTEIHDNSYEFSVKKEEDETNSFNAIFDFVKDFGPKETEGKTLNKIENEMKTETKKTKTYIEETNNIFQNSLDTTQVETKINKAKNSVDQFKLTLDDLYQNYVSKVLGYTEYIDKLGRIPLKIILIGAVLIIIGMAVLLIFLNIFGTSCCSCCKCALCPIKFFLHLFWNFIAIFMIALFFWGSIFCFLGVLGKDLSKVLEIIFGEDNLAINENPIIVQGVSRNYLYTCIHGQGDFVNDVDLLEAGSSTESIQQLKEIKYKIQNVLDLIGENPTIGLKSCDEFTSSNIDKKNFKIDTKIIEKGASTPKEYTLFGLLEKLNSYTKFETNPIKDLYTLTGTCNDETFLKISFTEGDYNKNNSPDHKYCVKIQDLKEVTTPGTQRYGVVSTPSDKPYTLNEAGDYYIPEINLIIKELNKETENANKIINEQILLKYRTLVSKEIDVLKDYIKKIDKLLEGFEGNLIKEENSSIYEFLNCKFAGKNMLIILKYLQVDLGVTLYKSGILLIFCACCMGIGIFCTILDMVVVDISVEEKKKSKDEEEQKVEINNSEEIRAKNKNE